MIKKSWIENTILFFLLKIWFVILNKKFLMFPQAEVLYKNNSNILDLIKRFHPHFPRYSLVLPTIYLEKITKIDVNIWYHFYIIILLIFSFSFLKKIILLTNKKIKIINKLIIFLFIILISSITNGRFIFAMFGEILFIYGIEHGEKRGFFSILIGLYFTTVSSGTMLIGITSCLIYFLLKVKFKKRYFLILIFLMLFSSKYIFLMINRNYKYFGNSILNILHHGIFGNFSLSLQILFCVLTIVILCFYLFIVKINIISILLVVSIIGGFFGRTTFFMCLVPFIIEINILLKKLSWRSSIE